MQDWFDAKKLDNLKKDGAAAIVHQEKKNSILSQIHRIIGPFILRRKKSDVAHDILPKKEVLVYCPFTLQQRQQYQAFMNTIKRQKANSDSQSNYFNMQYMMVIDFTKKKNVFTISLFFLMFRIYEVLAIIPI